MDANFLLYGASGYTGRLITRLAVERGRRPLLAGRDKDKIARVAREFDLTYRAFALDDAAALDAALGEVACVLHCAGPFARTSRPMADACLRTGAHYLDITGEVSVFEALAARDAEAQAAQVMLLPGVGFDVVPSDCLALHLKERLPTATRLALAIRGTGGISHGTATTMIENIHRGGLVRRGGRLTPVPAAWRTRAVDFGRGPTRVTTIPWGDVATAYYSTGIPDIETYAALPATMRWLMRASRPVAGLLAAPAVQRFLKRRIDARPAGPTDAERARGHSYVWGEVTDAAGGRAVARLRGPEGYTLTALTALNIVGRVLNGAFKPGFQTPARAYGADLIMEIDGVTRADVA